MLNAYSIPSFQAEIDKRYQQVICKGKAVFIHYIWKHFKRLMYTIVSG
jgi:hypothetical protein